MAGIGKADEYIVDADQNALGARW